MKETAYLILDRKGIRGVRKTRPSLKGTEVAIRLRVEIPDEFFERVIPDATLVIPEEAVLTPPVEIGVEPTWEDAAGGAE